MGSVSFAPYPGLDRASWATVIVDGLTVEVLAAPTPAAAALLSGLAARWPAADQVVAGKPDWRVAAGGDGFTLRALRASISDGVPVFAVNCGDVGFLTNPLDDLTLRPDTLAERLTAAEQSDLAVLSATIRTATSTHEVQAVNDVAIWRASAQAARLRVVVDDISRLERLVGDGALVATPAGSTGYNRSARGPVIPIGAELVALTPLNAYRPRHWPGALLSETSRIDFEVLDAIRRPVTVNADDLTFTDARSIEVTVDPSRRVPLAFDPGHRLDERVIAEQFES